MNTRAHRIRGSWPLYLVIAIAGAGSLATSPPPTWHLEHNLEGGLVTLDPDLREVVVPLTIRFSPEQDWSEVLISGAVEHVDAGEELWVSLVEPGQRTLASTSRRAQGDGRLTFHVSAPDASLRCDPVGSGACEQELAVVFNSSGARDGRYVVRWHVMLRTGGPGQAPPDGLIFDAELAGGRPVDFIPPLLSLFPPPDQPGPGRWRLSDGASSAFRLHPDAPSSSRRFTARAAGPYTGSQLFIPFMASRLRRADEPQETEEIALRVAVIPDPPGTGPTVEHVVTLAGEARIEALSVPAPLDCAGEPVCERGFTITVETDDEAAADVWTEAYVQAILDGAGDAAPAGAFVEIAFEEPFAVTGEND